MTVNLLNSAMMPVEGCYILRRVSSEEFGRLLRQADRDGALRSYIGYPQNADYLLRTFGVRVAVTREQTTLSDGDTMLCMRLPQRIANPVTKGATVPEEFEFFVCDYADPAKS